MTKHTNSRSESSSVFREREKRLVSICSNITNAIRSSSGLETLSLELKRLCDFDNFIVFIFYEGNDPRLIYGDKLNAFRKSMQGYINGLYLLDPFYRLTKERSTGIFRMRDIMPHDFPDSEYYNHFYRHTDVVDEFRYVTALPSNSSLHVFIEREGHGNEFSTIDQDILTSMQPMITAFVNEHMGWLFNSHEYDTGIPSPHQFDLQDRVRNMSPGSLTPREVDIVELMLKGYSTKAIARELKIDHGTVANHKRNLYAKLEIHSQAELFHMFLSSLVTGKF